MKTAALINETTVRSTYQLNTPLMFGCIMCGQQISTTSVSFVLTVRGTFFAVGAGDHVICECESIEGMLNGFGYQLMGSPKEQISRLKAKRDSLEKFRAEVTTLLHGFPNASTDATIVSLKAMIKEAQNSGYRTLREQIASELGLAPHTSDFELWRGVQDAVSDRDTRLKELLAAKGKLSKINDIIKTGD